MSDFDVRTDRYTCVGDIIGDCGVAHRTPEAADKCCKAFARKIRKMPGGNCYSDRVVHVLWTDVGGNRHTKYYTKEQA